MNEIKYNYLTLEMRLNRAYSVKKYNFRYAVSVSSCLVTDNIIFIN